MNSIAVVGGHQLTWASRTDVGKVRKVNEDSLMTADGLFVVADGMGGHAAGDIASQLTVASFVDRMTAGPLPIADLAGVIEHANATVMDHARDHHREGMGSTLVGLALADNGGEANLVVFNVGDSRCYVSDGEGVRQITRDHSEVQELVDSGEITAEEAVTHPHRNVVTRAIGIDPAVFADFVVLGPAASRRLMLCSDGVSGEVSFDDIERLLLDSARTPDEVADQLMALVLVGRAADNATLIVVDVVQTEAPLDDDVDVTGPRARASEMVLDPGVHIELEVPLLAEVQSSWAPPVFIDDVPAMVSGIDSRHDERPDVIDDVPS